MRRTRPGRTVRGREVVGRVVCGALLVVLLVGGTLVLPGTAGDGGAERTAQRAGVPATPASQKYRWQPSLFDFAWEYGESLTDRPGRGTKRQGGWLDATTGSGRAARHNGGLMLQSKYGVVAPSDAGPGDHGTTSITLEGNAQAFGRWEVRAATWGWSDPGRHYLTRIELVPEDDPDCRARSITVAELERGSSTTRFGAYAPAGRRAWTGSRSGIRQGQRTDAHSYAVEVGKKHVTWFVDSRPVGTVRSRAAVPGTPLTLRISLVGDGTAEMQHTYTIMDWVRAFSLERGTQVRSGRALRSGTHRLAC